MLNRRIVIYSRDLAVDGVGMNPDDEDDISMPFVELVKDWDAVEKLWGQWMYKDAQYAFEDSTDVYDPVEEPSEFNPDRWIEFFTLVWDFLTPGEPEWHEAINDSREIFDWLCANSDYDWALSYQGVPGQDLFRPSARTKEPFPAVVNPVILPAAS